MSLNRASAPHTTDATLLHGNDTQTFLVSLSNGHEYLLNRPELLVGRESECQITLDSGHISRYHAKISNQSGALILEDLGSTNGSYVNDVRIRQPHVLQQGDEVRFHELSFRVVQKANEFGSCVVSDQDSTRLLDTPLLSQAQRQVTVEAPSPLWQTSNLPDNPPSTTVDPRQAPSLVVMTAPLKGQICSLENQPDQGWSIGRSRACNLVVADPSVSEHHARVRRLAEEWVLEVMDSDHPVFINDRAVEFSTLSPGDIVRIGKIELAFQMGSTPANNQAKQTKFILSKTTMVLGLSALIVFGVVLGILLF